MIHEFERMCESVGMAQTVCVLPSAEDRQRLLAIVADRNRPLKHVQSGRTSSFVRPTVCLCRKWRGARASADPRSGAGKRDTPSRASMICYVTRRASPAALPLSARVVPKVMDLTCSEPPGHATHWTGRAMAKAVGVSLRAVQRLWEAHRLQPHRIRTFKRSNDPEFAQKVEDIVGLYMDAPKHAVVVSIDEKSQIQALDRTQPGLPLKPGKCGTMTHDYKRNGTTTLFAALNLLDGTVIGRCMRRHRHQEFIRFLNAVERAVPAGKVIHAIVDNYAAHKQPNVLKWLADHPRWMFHFTPTSASWLNAVEGFFSAITRRQIRRGAFHSVDDLQTAITRYIDSHNSDSRPFVWTTSAKAIFEKLAKIPVPSL
jgi:transposase